MPDQQFPEGHDEVLTKGPCPKCGSTDNLVTYRDGHAHCFSAGCGYFEKAQGPSDAHSGTSRGTNASSALLTAQGPAAYEGLTKRKLKAETLRRYGYFLAPYGGDRHIVQAAPYYSKEGELAGQKLRHPDKTFTVLKAHDESPGLGKCQLFGHHVYGDRFDRKVVVTEGELDCLTVAQAVDFSIAVVSVPTGAASAAKALKENYLWLDRFEEIILWFDDDEPGQLAAQECAKLFKVGKVRIAKAPGYKDASDIFQALEIGDAQKLVKEAVYMAQAWRPKGIVNAKENREDVLAPTDDTVTSWPWPPEWERVQELTKGIRLGEVVYHVAGTGVGKSTALHEIQAHLVQQAVKIGIMSFEDTRREAKLGIMSIYADQRLHLDPLPDDTMLTLHDKVFASGLVELFDPETADWAMDAIMGYVRYCAKALDCQVIFVDPLSFAIADLDPSADERRALDKVARDFSKLAKELNINLQVSHHLTRPKGIPHEEGAPTSLNELRGSGGLANFAMQIIGHERNGQAAGDAWRVTQLRVLKARFTGKSGLADVLYYEDTGRLTKSHIPFPPMGKPSGEDAGSPFPPGGTSQDY